MVRSGGGRTVPFLCLQKGHFETSISATQRIAVSPHPRPRRPTIPASPPPPLPFLHLCSFRFHNTRLEKNKKETRRTALITFAQHPLSPSPGHFNAASVLEPLCCSACPRCVVERARRGGSRRTTQRHVKHPPRPFRCVPAASPPNRSGLIEGRQHRPSEASWRGAARHWPSLLLSVPSSAPPLG